MAPTLVLYLPEVKLLIPLKPIYALPDSGEYFIRTMAHMKSIVRDERYMFRPGTIFNNYQEGHIIGLQDKLAVLIGNYSKFQIITNVDP